MIRLSTMPVVPPPSRLRSRDSASRIALVVVSVRSMVIAVSSCGRRRPGGRHGGTAHSLRQLRQFRASSVRGGRPSVPAGYCSGWPADAQNSDRVQDPPGQLDLFLPREQRRVADQHVEQQPFVGLRAGLGERPP
jgi:hypothetical protein